MAHQADVADVVALEQFMLGDVAVSIGRIVKAVAVRFDSGFIAAAMFLFCVA